MINNIQKINQHYNDNPFTFSMFLNVQLMVVSREFNATVQLDIVGVFMKILVKIFLEHQPRTNDHNVIPLCQHVQ